MDANLGIKEMLKLAIAMEDEGVEYYTALAEKADKSNLIYKPNADKVSWSEDKGFYIELARKVLGEGHSSFYKLPEKITHQDSIAFYNGIGKRVLEDVKSVLLGMASDEKRHGELFRKWLAGLDEETANNAFSSEANEFFDMYSKNLKFDSKDDAPATIDKALERAIATEDGAVEFYSGMLRYADPSIKELLEKIVNEEKGHKTKLEAQKDKFDALMA